MTARGSMSGRGPGIARPKRFGFAFPQAWRAPGLALGFGLAAAVVLIVLSSSRPFEALRFFFVGPVSNAYFLGNMLNEAGFLFLTGLGASLAFRSGCFNLGGEGQVYAGGFAATLLLIYADTLPGFLGIILACLAAAAVGAVIAGISGWLKARYGVDELISSFLLSNALIPIIDYLVAFPLKNPASNLLATPSIGEAFRLPSILPPSHLNAAFPVAVILILALRFVYGRTVFGFELRITGSNKEFARAQGIVPGRYYLLGMAGSGALHALAGAFAILGTYFACHKGFSAGLGWNGIAVALIAGNSPLALIPSALIFSYADAGAETALLHTDFSFEAGSLIQGAVFLFITARLSRDAGFKERIARLFRRKE